MGLFTGSFKLKVGSTYTMQITTPSAATGTFKIIGEVISQTGNSISKTEDIFEPIKATKLNFSIKDFLTSAAVSFYESELKGANSDDIQITIDNGSEFVFTGYLIPKGIELNKYYDFPAVSILASDGLALLKQIPFDLSGNYTLVEALRNLILPASPIPSLSFLYILTDWQETNMTSTSPTLIRFDIGLFAKGKRNATYWDVLEGILRRFGFVLSYNTLDGDISFHCVKRNIQGNNTTLFGYVLSTGVSSTYAYDDSETITTANIEKNYFEGQLNPIQKVITNFEWDNTNPPLLNTNFQTWNAANTIPTSWTVESGAFSKQTNSDSNTVARSTNDGILYQKLRFIKPPYQSFSGNVELQILINALAPDVGSKTFRAVKVKFIDPNGVDADTYLQPGGTTTTSETWLTYTQQIDNPGTVGTIVDKSISFALGSSSTSYLRTRIVEVYLWGNRDDVGASGPFLDYVQFVAVTVGNFNTSTPDFRETIIEESFAGDVIENNFSLSDQTPFNAIGAIEVYNGSSWLTASNWGSGYSFDETYTRMINAQTKANLLYMKVKIGPTYFAGRVFTDVITFGGVEFVPVMFLRNYLKSTIDIQMIELRNDTPGTVSETYLIED